MAKSLWVSLILFMFLNSQLPSSQAQQEYVNNKQLDCDSGIIYNATFGNLCNSVSHSCNSYLTFRSIAPLYNTPSSIAFLLNSDPSAIAKANNISDVAPIADNTIVIVPVNCSCSGKYYQYNASYVLKQQGETYFSVANNTYQALTTCQAIENQNVYDKRNLSAGMKLNVPLRCACPTKKQEDSGFKYLLTYLVAQGESVDTIGAQFGVDGQSVSDANELSANAFIFYFTPILVPLRKEPNPIKVASPPPPPPSPPPPAASSTDSSSSKKGVIIGVTVGAVLILLIGLSGFLFWSRRRRHRKSQLPSSAPKSIETNKKTVDSGGTTQSWSISSEGIRYAIDSLTVYRFEDLQKATSFFSEANKIKGSVYRATFKGDDAAVKIYKGDVSKEIGILKRLNHTNITRLSGFCVHKGDTYLVYEFADNGSLDDWLHPKDKIKNNFQDSSSTILNWRQRVQIAHDIADTLNYLHNYTNPPYIHKNLQSGNVLLDGNFRAKVSNFALARVLEDDEEEGGFQVTRHVIGTQGYMAPEYIENGMITPKMDVFALGVVILELISGKEAIVGEDKLLSSCVKEVLEGDNVREKLRGFVDPSFGDEYPLDLVYSMAQVAKRCVERDMNTRPVISEVLMTLSKIQSSTLDWDPSDELDRSRSVSKVSGAR
ncbi:hypothetical protein QN277_016893 [Acacia crassicarpa]|nr:hypothetical protein QN277_016893 [Acacia crassicarpa]